MKPLETLLKNAARSRFRIVLSEGADPRVVAAALIAERDGIARMILIGAQEEVEAELSRQNAPKDHGITVFDPQTSSLLPELASLYHHLRAHKGISAEEALSIAQDPHVFAALLVKSGRADGTVGGAVATTADIVRTAIQVIGPAPGSRLISSFFLMLFCADHHARKGAHIFADSGLVVDPNAEEMAQIAAASAASFEALTGEVARVAMLSFSTHGSAQHNSVSKVVTATELARNANPKLLIDGELQFDAAFDPDVAEKKAELSPLKGEANVFIFPNLESGNIAYKIAQRIGGAIAIGPILQGLAKPANDLSRGCSAEDVLHMIAVTAAQATAQLGDVS
ncbi:phosphate acetyltransferase [Aliiroseovarius crassostreae]|uniref:phosphate acetyltransferase n=1 Tax=Aliiroseovarius crassostreae TaxID=154981 RepID=UPI0021AECEF8|nr:phosphate acetyltransferase [Aliiroseovarius crassostreae]UWP99366.1 phosphate acetyltransferase [Aliiroseovarius crassostreae]UWQ08840.1 phosphate acetyltransferase [Aliiroseovarius crassostreae]UWQ11921.1 phosphate acetyltransferase [Aliiroseovarius crassostreae]